MAPDLDFERAQLPFHLRSRFAQAGASSMSGKIDYLQLFLRPREVGIAKRIA
jgi:hypothetical protein